MEIRDTTDNDTDTIYENGIRVGYIDGKKTYICRTPEEKNTLMKKLEQAIKDL